MDANEPFHDALARRFERKGGCVVSYPRLRLKTRIGYGVSDFDELTVG
ncbi:MAG: hypothetical protein ACE5H9_05960 [Anaerolineae bacterium]